MKKGSYLFSFHAYLTELGSYLIWFALDRTTSDKDGFSFDEEENALDSCSEGVEEVAVRTQPPASCATLSHARIFNMQLSICSFSFNHLLAQGQQDVFQYISTCKEFGCTQLDPWNGHLAQLQSGDQVLEAGRDPEHAELSVRDEEDYIQRVKEAGNAAGLPFGCLAVDGAHIYDEKPEYRALFRSRAYRWIEIAQTLGAKQIRLDSGGSHEMPDEMFDIIVEGFRDLVARGREAGVEVVMENHWGASQVPENVVRILEAAPGLGLLFDTNNWAPGRQEDGWKMCAKYARITHIKTFNVSDDLVEASADVDKAIGLLVEAGYDGCWGIESCPEHDDEMTGVRKTIQLTRNALEKRAHNGEAAHV